MICSAIPTAIKINHSRIKNFIMKTNTTDQPLHLKKPLKPQLAILFNTASSKKSQLINTETNKNSLNKNQNNNKNKEKPKILQILIKSITTVRRTILCYEMTVNNEMKNHSLQSWRTITGQSVIGRDDELRNHDTNTPIILQKFRPIRWWSWWNASCLHCLATSAMVCRTIFSQTVDENCP